MRFEDFGEGDIVVRIGVLKKWEIDNIDSEYVEIIDLRTRVSTTLETNFFLENWVLAIRRGRKRQ